MSDGSYEQRNGMWSVRYRDTAGKQRRQSGFRSKTDAKAWNVQRVKDRNDGILHDPDLTFRGLAAQYLGQHDASEQRIAKLRYMLTLANEAFGDVLLADLTAQRIGAWRMKLSEGTRHDALAAVKQVLKAAVEWRVLSHSPASGIKNPVPKRREATPFVSWADIEAIEAAINPLYRLLPTIVTGTNMRPQEWVKVKFEHVDFDQRVLVLPQSVVKPKTPPRRIPIREKAMQAIEELGRDRGLMFVNKHGGPIDLRSWRRYEWMPALEAANLEYRPPYDMRHTWATWALRAGMPTFTVARRMGTSVSQIEDTYGHLAIDSEDHERFLMDSFDRPVMETTFEVMA